MEERGVVWKNVLDGGRKLVGMGCWGWLCVEEERWIFDGGVVDV